MSSRIQLQFLLFISTEHYSYGDENDPATRESDSADSFDHIQEPEWKVN